MIGEYLSSRAKVYTEGTTSDTECCAICMEDFDETNNKLIA